MCRSGKVKDHKIGLQKPADAFGPARCAGPKPHDRANIDTAESQLLYAAIAAAVGLYFTAVGACLLPIPGGPSNLHSPLWVLLCAGAVFFFASAPLVIQSFGASTATGELPADAPRWLRILQYVIAVAIFGCFARSQAGSHSGRASGSCHDRQRDDRRRGCTASGIGAVIIWLTAAVIASGIRKLFDQ
jgi:hypothetical protein